MLPVLGMKRFALFELYNQQRGGVQARWMKVKKSTSELNFVWLLFCPVIVVAGSLFSSHELTQSGLCHNDYDI